MQYVAGIDVGSLSTEVVILDSEARIAGESILETGFHSTRAAERAFEAALAQAGLPAEAITTAVATGYGRISVPFAAKRITEISCHAVGAWRLFPDTGTVIDIGGQDSKVIQVGKGGRVLDFTMNDKCAAGTGRFLDVMAAKLEVPLGDLGRLSLEARREATISSVCTVFAESEVVSLVARNHPREEIIRGIHRSIVHRVISMVRVVGVQGEVTMTGGVALNQGVVAMLSEELGRPVHVPAEPRTVGAFGAALHALESGAQAP